MNKLARALSVAGLAAGLFASLPARADLPPPPGQTKIQYAFRVTGATPGVVLVAFPTYSPDNSTAAALTPDKDVPLYQGYRPGIYSLPAADVASLAGKDRDATEKILAAKGHRCIENVPRVYQVPTETKILAMVDVIRIDASPTDCRASLQKTIYRGEGSLEGEGGIDASGRRTAPSPFSADDLPAVTGFVASPPSTNATPTNTAPPGPSSPDSPPPSNSGAPSDSPAANSPPAAPNGSGGCAGCATPVAPVAGGGVLALLALGSIALRRSAQRRRHRR